MTIENMDALDYLRTLPDSHVDLLVTDPPYFRVKDEPWDRAWAKPEQFLAWLGTIADEWQRILKPNGSLYCFASPQMAARVEVMLGERFNVLNSIVWAKPPHSTKAEMFVKADLRAYFPATERIVFCEQRGADNIVKGEAGYVAKCDELRGFVFEPLRAYLEGERVRAGWRTEDIGAAWMKWKGKESKWTTRLAGHWFETTQWIIPTRDNYEWLRETFNAQGGDYLRREYEDLRREYEDLRRPFTVTADVPYTDVWAYKTVQAGRGKHSCAKPWDMAIDIVEASSREGGIVCDPFCGSGVFLEAAAALKREPIGNDGAKHWADVTRRAVAHPRPIRQERLL